MKTGIALFVYNRPEHTKKVLDGLKRNGIEKLYIFADGPKNQEHLSAVKEVGSIIELIEWCQTEVINSDYNKGLANSIIDGVNYIFEKHERVIVLEDDCVPSNDYIFFMESCFDKYADDNEVMNVTGYCLPVIRPFNYHYDIYFTYRSCSWGWGTWKRAWEYFSCDVSVLTEIKNNPLLSDKIKNAGRDLIPILECNHKKKLDIWAAFWAIAIIKNSGICINPVISKIQNIGFDGTGVHCHTADNRFDVELSNGNPKSIDFPPKINIEDYFVVTQRTFFGNISGCFDYRIIAENDEVIIFGAGKAGKEVLEVIQQNTKAKIKFFMDNDPKKWGNDYMGFNIMRPDLDLLNSVDRIIIASSWREEIKKQLVDMGLKVEKLI
jgi:hypothetical protein